MARWSAKICELTDAKVEFGENFQGAHERAMMTAGERAHTCGISGPACVCARTELFRQEQN